MSLFVFNTETQRKWLYRDSILMSSLFVFNTVRPEENGFIETASWWVYLCLTLWDPKKMAL